MLRGLIQGWPKQFGETWMTRDFRIASKAGPTTGQAGRYGASLSVCGRRLAEASVAVQEETAQLPSPAFAGAALVRFFPELEKAKQGTPAVHELVRLKSRDVTVSPVRKGPAAFTIFDHPYTELSDLRPARVLCGYRFTVACTIDDLELLKRY
jgi:acetoacetate decarboxylase